MCGQREYPPRTPGLGSRRAGLQVPPAHRAWVTLLEPGFGGTASSSQSYRWVWARWWGFLGEMGFSGPQLPLLLGELRPPSPLPPQLSVTVVATTGAAASDQTTVPVCMASRGLSVREVPSWAWGRGLGGWRRASWQPLRCSQALGSSSWPPFCCLRYCEGQRNCCFREGHQGGLPGGSGKSEFTRAASPLLLQPLNVKILPWLRCVGSPVGSLWPNLR